MDTNDALKGLLAGAVGGAVGTLAMGLYWRAVRGVTGEDPRRLTNTGQPGALDDISLAGDNTNGDEGSTAAVGRMAYQKVQGELPDARDKEGLSQAVHWTYGTTLGAVYGALRGRAGGADPAGGLAFGTAMWALGDELAVPLLGLSKGPTAYPVKQHAHRMASHLVYGLAAAATTQGLLRVLAPRRSKTQIAWDTAKSAAATYLKLKAASKAAKAVTSGLGSTARGAGKALATGAKVAAVTKAAKTAAGAATSAASTAASAATTAAKTAVKVKAIKKVADAVT